MKVLVPFCPGRLMPETVQAVAVAATYRYHEAEIRFVDTSHTILAYWELLNDVWGEGEGFCVVENDNVPRPDSLREMWECEHGWCAFAYEFAFGFSPALGCTKFAREVVAGFPDLMRAVREDELWPGDDKHPTEEAPWPRGHCRNLDQRIYMYLWNHNYAGPHLHGPPIGHLNPAQAKIANLMPLEEL